MEEQDITKIEMELESYILEMQEAFPEKLTQEDLAVKISPGDRIPGKKETMEIPPEERKNPLFPGKPLDKKTRDAFLHYTSEDTIPYIPLKTVNEALSAVKELEKLKNEKRDYMVVFLSDAGDRAFWFSKSKKEARRFADKLFREYMDFLSGPDKMEPTYIDEKDGTGFVHEPTPLKYVDADESMKCKALVDGKIHRYKSDDHFVIYNELTEQTARWDIYDLSQAKNVEDEMV